ncbi:MAG TPA: tetratricopeptide repeat protein [Phycisphaerae bacterium]|nr:tetratricopeptide repeat protein [Phycisphaerae bacterium]
MAEPHRRTRRHATGEPEKAKQPARRRADIYVLIAVLLAAVLLRALYLREAVADPRFEHPGIDAAYHDHWATGLATGDWRVPTPYADPMIRQTAYLRPPGYPYFLAGIYTLFGPHHLAAAIVQMVIGVGNCALMFLFARRGFGRATAVVAAALMAVHWTFVYFEPVLLAPTLLITLTILLLYVLALWAEKVTVWRALAAGLLLGCAALVRPNVLLFAPVVVVWAVWAVAHRQGWRPFALATGALAAGSVAAIAPATIRNAVVARDFVPISSNLGINLYIGNSEVADGYVVDDLPGLGRFATCFDYRSVVRSVQQQAGRPLSDSEVSRYLAAKATDYIKTHPWQTLRLIGKRAFLFWGPREIAHNQTPHFDRMHSTALRLVPTNFPSLLSLALVGAGLTFWQCRTRSRRQDEKTPSEAQWSVLVLPVLFVLTWFVSFLPFFVAARYRVPIQPWLALFAACGLVTVARLFAARRWRMAGACIGVCAGLYLLANVNFGGYVADEANPHHQRAVAYQLGGQLDKAIDAYRRVLQLRPDHDEAHANLGVLLAARGQLDQALAHYNESLRVRGDRAEVHSNLAILLAQKGQIPQAVEHLRQALQLKPDYPEAHNNLASLLIGMGQFAQAAEHLREALNIDSAQPAALESLAWLYATCPQDTLRNGPEAVRLAQHLCQLTDNDPSALDTLAAAYAETGQFAQAVAAAQQAVSAATQRGQSELAPAFEARRRLYRAGQPFREPSPSTR